MTQYLATLISNLKDEIAQQNGSPGEAQYRKAVVDAAEDYNNRNPMRKHTVLNINRGTASYDLPADFSFFIDLEALGVPGGVGFAASGKLIAISSDFTEDHTIVGGQITFVPTPMYSAARELWYAARYILTPDPDTLSAWQADTPYGVGDLIQSTSPDGVLYFECTQAGTSGSSEPDWSTTIGAKTDDNEAKWTTRSLAYADMDADTGRIVLLKAQVLLLKFKDSQAAGKGWRYKIGDEEVDKSKVGSGDQSRINRLNNEYLEAVASKIGHVAMRG